LCRSSTAILNSVRVARVSSRDCFVNVNSNLSASRSLTTAANCSRASAQERATTIRLPLCHILPSPISEIDHRGGLIRIGALIPVAVQREQPLDLRLELRDPLVAWCELLPPPRDQELADAFHEIVEGWIGLAKAVVVLRGGRWRAVVVFLVDEACVV